MPAVDSPTPETDPAVDDPVELPEPAPPVAADAREEAAGDEARPSRQRRVPPPPRVRAVVVAHEPGEWFVETLHALASQDYRRLEVVVLVPGGDPTVHERVAAALPDAAVRDVDARLGYAACANDVLVDDDRPPAFYLFCHDDVALAPDAVRLLVEEAVRSNGAVLGPKLVSWERPDVLAEVGLDVDKLAHVASRVEAGELDQEQHDAVRDVFAVSGAVQLVRADLFGALGGYDATMGLTGEDVDLCWRTHVAGARVIVVPSAVARHRAGIEGRRGSDDLDRERNRNRIRTVLTGYGLVHSIRVIPQALIYSMVRSLGALVTGQFGRARTAIGAWTWNLRRMGSLRRRRAELRSIRRVPDGELRRLQIGGFAPLSGFLRGQLESDTGGSIAVRARYVLQALRTGPSQISIAFWFVTAAVLIFGSRHLVTRRVPAVGDLVAFDRSVGELFAGFFGQWRPTGAGTEAAAPTAHALTALGGVVLFGSMGLLRTILTVGMLPIGAIGMWRFLRPFASPWIRVVGTMMYLASPVPYTALSNGTWGGLLLYGSMPWILAGLARAGRMAPFGGVGGSVGEGVLAPSVVREVLVLGLTVALVGAYVPFVVVLVVLAVAALVLGSWLAGRAAGALRLIGVTAAALALAAVLHLPWLVGLVGSEANGDWFFGTRPEQATGATMAELLTLFTGGIGGGVLGWALPVAAGVPLLLARGPRWSWAVRGIALYLVAVGVIWAETRGWVPVSAPRPEIVLALGSFGLALAAAMGVAAIERDLRAYRLGWRQLVPVSAVVAIALAMVTPSAASLDGWWQMPTGDFARQYAAEPDPPGRVLWIGHDDTVSAAGRAFGEGLTLAVTDDLLVGYADRWDAGVAPADPLIAEAVELAVAGGTSRLGRLLAPFGIAEIVVLEQSAPSPSTGLVEPVPEQLKAALSEQLDLALVDVSPGVTRLTNNSALSFASVVDIGATSNRTLREHAASGTTPRRSLDQSGSSGTRFVGRVGVDDEVYVAAPTGSNWRLITDGRAASRGPALDWALAFRPTVADAEAELSHRTPTEHQVMMIMQLALWAVAIVATLRVSGRAREARA